jgi:hypothetical protein
MKVVQIAAASINARVYLHAGSHLGAVIHGQPIPWDDDIDLTIEFQKIRDFEKICQGDGLEVHPSGVRLRCVSHFNSLKVWLHPPGYQKMTPLDKEWYSPFVDLFAYEIGEGKLKEVFLNRNSLLKPNQTYFLTDYFPTRPYYFAGRLHVHAHKIFWYSAHIHQLTKIFISTIWYIKGFMCLDHKPVFPNLGTVLIHAGWEDGIIALKGM